MVRKERVDRVSLDEDKLIKNLKMTQHQNKKVADCKDGVT